MKGKQFRKTQPSSEKEILAAGALPPATEREAAASGSGLLFASVPLIVVGLLLLGAAAVPPRRVRSAAVAEVLFLHRTDLMAFGLGAVALALLCLNIAVLF